MTPTEHRKRALSTEAREAATHRGHTLGRFIYTFEGVTRGGVNRITGIATCSRCGREVQIDTYPPPNGTDIAGEAVALGCLVVNEPRARARTRTYPRTSTKGGK